MINQVIQPILRRNSCCSPTLGLISIILILPFLSIKACNTIVCEIFILFNIFLNLLYIFLSLKIVVILILRQ